MEDDTPPLDFKILKKYRMKSVPAPGEHLPGTKPGEPEPDCSDIPEVGEEWFKKAVVVKPVPDIHRLEDDGGPPNPKEET